jgi:putative transposase
MSRPPRLTGFDYLGPHRYFLTFCTHKRRERFRDSQIVAMVVRHFRRTARREGFAIRAYCVMPEHVHLLIEGTTAQADLRRFVKATKRSSGQVYARMNRGCLWSEGCYDRILKRDTDAREVARYIVWNPVRAGLTDTPAAYPYLGSDLLSVEDLCAV